MHRNRKNSPKTWGIPKKGSKYVIRDSGQDSLPLVVALRNMLKLAETKKEVKKILHNEYVKVNNYIIKDEKFLLKLNDVLSLKDKNFRVVFNDLKKFDFVEISDKETNEKIAKVIDKKRIDEKIIQVNLSDGRNYLVPISEKISVGDSCVINLKDKKIKEILKLQVKVPSIIIEGKHLGKRGKIKSIDLEKKTVVLATDKEEISVKINQVMIEK